LRLRTIVVPLATVLASALVPGAAFAKVTKNPKNATHVLPCDDGSHKNALVWYTTDAKSWAVDNQCKTKWVVVDGMGASQSDPYGEALSVAPKTKFQTRTQWITSDFEDGPSMSLSPKPWDGTEGTCSYGYTLWEIGPKDHGRFRHVFDCPSAPWA
jgi:hypothetical protein